MIESTLFALKVYFLAFVTALFIAIIIKAILFFIRKTSKKTS